MKYLQYQINKRLKNNQFYLILIVILSCLLITSICLFIFLSNYKIQILLSVVGSIVNSLIAVTLIIIILAYFLPNRTYLTFLKKIQNSNEEIMPVDEMEQLDSRTIKKNITLKRYLINSKELFLLNDQVEFAPKDQILIVGNYIIEKVNTNE